MDPLSTIGTIIGIAGLYIVCLEMLEQASAMADFGKDSQHILSALQIEKLYCKKWGERIGIGKETKDQHRFDGTIDEYDAVQSILLSLGIVWSDTDALSKKYGLEQCDIALPHKTSLRRKFVWASRDKKKMKQLLEDLGTFTRKLYELVPTVDDGRPMVDSVDWQSTGSGPSLDCMIPFQYRISLD